jgi:sensor c-di-GMP phosphodiesterase-like protein
VPGNASGTQARLALRDGTTIATVGANPETPHDPASRLTATVRSERYGIIAAASMSQADVTTAVSHLHALGLVITGVIAVLILVFAFIALRGSERNPVTQISEALEAGQFVPYYQPIIDIKTGRLRGAEVLARWCKPDASVVSPAEFIALMETSGLIFEFTRAIMGKARDEVGLAYQCRPDLHLAFNVSAHHLAEERVVDELKELFDGAAVRLSQIVIELTERQPLEDLTEGRRVIAALQGLGVRIAIDDVGTGHSGLSYMLKLGPDIVKIDKMFVDAAISDRNSSNIIETLVDLAGKLRMDLIAEGVQTFDQLTYLREIGVSMAQGYVFAPPLPGPSFLRLVDAANPASPPAEEAIADPPRSAARN